MLKNYKYSRLPSFLFCALLLGTSLFLSTSGYAQTYAGCAPDTWTAMANRAAMETRREDVMNKRYIVKADSVLQYSCFSGELLRVQGETSRIFSNGDQWINRPVELSYNYQTVLNPYDPSPTRLHTGQANGYDISISGGGTDYKTESGYVLGDTTLSYNSMEYHIANVVGNDAGGPLFNYIDANFGHNVLSDTTNLGYHGLCYTMSDVWRAAKCKNFDGVAAFYSFEDLENVPNFISDPDPREFPRDEAYECTL